MQYATFQKYLDAKYQGPFMATDIIIRYDDGIREGIVLIERKYPPYGVAIPGGISEKMTLHENAAKEAKEETGLEVILDNPLQPFCVLSEVGQDPRAFIATAVYTAQGFGELKPYEEEDAKNAKIYTLDEVAELVDSDNIAFGHHRKILQLYLQSEGYAR